MIHSECILGVDANPGNNRAMPSTEAHTVIAGKPMMTKALIGELGALAGKVGSDHNPDAYLPSVETGRFVPDQPLQLDKIRTNVRA
ncbi:hypothetical protein [Ruegeria sp. HKCCD6604]|uniref:hypothetical protein n=1 Tax=Ruegeria sp. HKCCD6604 TaxID=2683000 RepID=UPI00149284ED|nr:hypothetical protein [Ruegeria sp. HKCCD6604]NOC91815.1 hypothetical protein [Ruegeria sp. HKCCD6604]